MEGQAGRKSVDECTRITGRLREKGGAGDERPRRRVGGRESCGRIDYKKGRLIRRKAYRE